MLRRAAGCDLPLAQVIQFINCPPRCCYDRWNSSKREGQAMATAFTFEAVADDVAAGGDGGIGLTVDKAGNPSIAFLQPGNGQIVVARRNGGSWTHENAQGAFVSFESRPCIAI